MMTKSASKDHEILIQGQLDSPWQTRFESLTISRLANGETLIAGPVNDQTELFGFLA